MSLMSLALAGGSLPLTPSGNGIRGLGKGKRLEMGQAVRLVSESWGAHGVIKGKRDL